MIKSYWCFLQRNIFSHSYSAGSNSFTFSPLSVFKLSLQPVALCEVARADDINIENCWVPCGGGGEETSLLWRLQLSGGTLALLCEAELLLQGLWHLGGRGAGQAEVDLNRVVDEPLQCSQCTDHDDTGNQTLPYTWNTKITDTLAHPLFLNAIRSIQRT